MDEPYVAERVTLPGGLPVVLRAIRPDDAPRLQEFVLRLSPRTLYFRANTPLKTLTAADARRLARVDYDRRMAIAATREMEGHEEIIGVARYAAAPGAGDAEVAIVVEDAYQGRGLGRLLLKRLAAHARGRDLQSFVANVSPQNEAVLGLIRSSGLPTAAQEVGPGERQVRVFLVPAGD